MEEFSLCGCFYFKRKKINKNNKDKQQTGKKEVSRCFICQHKWQIYIIYYCCDFWGI